jgi:hypothetical protein
MTIPTERTNAIIRAREFLRKLCRPGVKFTKYDLRHEIYYLLKHYPTEYDLERITKCKKCSEILGK